MVIILVALTIDRNGILWIGTNKGLSKFDGNSWSNFLPNDAINSIAVDDSSNKWICTETGLVKLNDKNTIRYSTSDGLPSDILYSISIDSDGNKWIGTFNGLVKYDNIVFNVFNTSNSGLKF